MPLLQNESYLKYFELAYSQIKNKASGSAGGLVLS